MAGPTQAGFLAFIRDIARIPEAALPDDSEYIPAAYGISLALVYVKIAQASQLIYNTCVYNLGVSTLINFAQDPVPPTAFLKVGDENLPYWQAVRRQYGTFSFSSGVVSSTADQGSSTSILNPEWMKNLTLANLQQLKDPYGRAYLSYAQSAGGLWGLTP